MTDTAPWEVLVKNSLMNCLQEHAAELGICYVCHAKTLGALKNQVQHFWEKMLHGKILHAVEY
jgi:hypothetical protein